MRVVRVKTHPRSPKAARAAFYRRRLVIVALAFAFGVLAAALAGCSCPASAPTRTFCDDVEKLLSASAPAPGANPTRWARDVALITSNARTIKELHK